MTKIALSLLLIVCTSFFRAHAAGLLPPVPAEVEKAVLAEDWAKVFELIGKVKPEASAPLRFIMGHTCLALNRNNESLVLFRRAAVAEDLAAWQTYARNLKKRNPKAPIADYFVGDSLARVENYVNAVEAFDAGLRASPSHALSLNAKGVCLARVGKLVDARKCFDAATSARDVFADAWANLGYHWIQKSDGPEGAVRAFSHALHLSDKFALARHGRGCAFLILKDRNAKRDFEEASNCDELVAGLMQANYISYAVTYCVAAGGGDPQELLADVTNPGTTLKRDYSLEKMGQDTRNWFKAGEAANRGLGNMKWLPFNQRIGACGAELLREQGCRTALEDERSARNRGG